MWCGKGCRIGGQPGIGSFLAQCIVLIPQESSAGFHVAGSILSRSMWPWDLMTAEPELHQCRVRHHFVWWDTSYGTGGITVSCMWAKPAATRHHFVHRSKGYGPRGTVASCVSTRLGAESLPAQCMALVPWKTVLIWHSTGSTQNGSGWPLN